MPTDIYEWFTVAAQPAQPGLRAYYKNLDEPGENSEPVVMWLSQIRCRVRCVNGEYRIVTQPGEHHVHDYRVIAGVLEDGECRAVDEVDNFTKVRFTE